MSRNRPPRRCSRCDAPVLWWRNANREGHLCVDASSDDNGNVQKIVTREGDQVVVYGRKLSGVELADAISTGELLFTVHATTCGIRRTHNPKPAGLEIPWPETSKMRKR